MKTIRFFLICLLSGAAVIAASGCSWFGSKHEAEKTAEQLVKEGAEFYRDGDYKEAINSFTTLKDWYPFSKYAILAEMKIADSHYEREEYDEAIAAYQEFESLHPKNDAIPYIIYSIGMCWYNQIPRTDKDQSFSQKALDEFTRLMDQYPDDPHAQKADIKRRECISRLATHEMVIGKFYMKSKHYKAAMKRFEYLFATYPDSDEGKEALALIMKCQELMEN
ncbi:MAG: outer membrane protein assembly factor BamD [Pseudomonadota bacterium]